MAGRSPRLLANAAVRSGLAVALLFVLATSSLLDGSDASASVVSAGRVAGLPELGAALLLTSGISGLALFGARRRRQPRA